MRLAPRADHWWTVGEGVVIDVPPWEPRPQRGPAAPRRVPERQQGVGSGGLNCGFVWWA
jgi:hypothetical protein